jgi:hypothetical protein
MNTTPASMNRRTLLKGSMQCLVATGLMPLSWATPLPEPIYALGAVYQPNRGYSLSAVNHHANTVWTTPLNARCHGGCSAPEGSDIVVFERRPGWSFHVLNSLTGEIRLSRSPEAEEHFYGHGVFSLDGRFLYATASHYESGQGRIAIFDTFQGYRRTGTWELEGIGPHQLELSPDGSRLIVALGGIRTHPDYDRIKLNLDDMDPALLFIDRLTGQEISRHRPSDAQLSCRHLAVTNTSVTYVACQYQGPDWQQPPLIGRHQDGHWAEIQLPDSLQPRLNNYLASIAVQSTSEVIVVTAPRSGLVVVLEGTSGRVIRDIALTDAAGAKATDDGGFLVSSGTGEWLWLDPYSDFVVGARGSSQWAWDNHLF